MLWITIGIAASSQMRKMNNKEVILWVNSIFYKKSFFKYISR
jgi:hypothetical protein